KTPNSPDLHPFDYYVWNVIERVTNACQHFRTRIEVVIEAKGGYIE
ncbi:hypothetical protein X777_08776, partial [Ooceraea biroi]